VVSSKKLIVGVLALQGDFAEHILALEKCGATAIPVRTPAEAEGTQGLIMPGGESTAIGKLLITSGLKDWLIVKAKTGYPIYGTCAGCILIAKQVDSDYSLQLIDITVKRNAYGRQIDSFDETIQSTLFPKLTGVFIRAPKITSVGKNTTVLATHQDVPVLVQQDTILAGTFHPELSDDLTVHQYFVKMVKAAATASLSHQAS